MGKKTKVGKQRKDKFYHLAKETGFRSRAAFKLIQLNRKFEFLQKSRVIVDLCAAPGGWTQVAAQNTPVSSIIIGIDLVSIKSIPNAITIQSDITTEHCRQQIKKNLQTWKADCFLNDGAPNVGKNWIHDAFQQNQLTLHALKLSAEFLRKGGWFITKVFRSKDYFSLMWVFKQLFKKVHATKPQASRNESAEIFIVCEQFLAPDKTDPKFFDPKHVFKELVGEKQPGGLDLMHPEKHRRQREGYADDAHILFHTLKATEFINSDNYLELLSHASEIKLDDDQLVEHSATTGEMKECLKDIKVLGKREIRNVINWRKKMKRIFYAKEEKTTDETTKSEDVEDSEDEDEKIQKKLTALQEEENKSVKKKQKKVRREKIKLQHKMDMKMIIPGDRPDFADDIDLFNLKELKTKKELEIIKEGDISMMDVGENHVESSSDEEELGGRHHFDRDEKDDFLDSTNYFGEDDIEEIELPSDDDYEGEDDQIDDQNPLMVDFEDDMDKSEKSRLQDWFSKDSFAGLEDDDDDEDMDVEQMEKKYEKKGGSILKKGEPDVKEQKKKKSKTDGKENKELHNNKDNERVDKASDNSDLSDSDSESDTDSESDSDYDDKQLLRGKNKTEKFTKRKDDHSKKKDGFEIVPATDPSLRLDPLGLAIGSAMVQSRKRKRDLIDGGYHRYMYDDDNLPDWFSNDEQKHTRRQLPVTKEDVLHYREKMKALDARPIKKVAQAKARRHRKLKRREDKARKKAEVITDAPEMCEKEKWSQVKHIYKKAGLLNQKKKDVAYVVAKKANAGRRMTRPKGTSGPYKVVDRRMKADKRGDKIRDDKKNQKGRHGRKKPRRH